MYEAALAQAALCTTAAGPGASIHAFPHDSDDTIIRARILWYAHMHEGITTGMRGGRFVLYAPTYKCLINYPTNI